MSKPKRIQRKRTKGWKMPPGAVYVGRPTMFGNPFDNADSFRRWLVDGEIGLSSLIDRKWFPWRPESKQRLDVLRWRILANMWALRGKDLVCWCPLVDEDGEPVACHADVLLELANR